MCWVSSPTAACPFHPIQNIGDDVNLVRVCPQCKHKHYDKKIYCKRCRHEKILRYRGMPSLARQQVAAAAVSTDASAGAPATGVSDPALLNASMSDASGFDADADADADAAIDTDFEVGDEAVRERLYLLSDFKYSLIFSFHVPFFRLECAFTHMRSPMSNPTRRRRGRRSSVQDSHQ